jgi:hypothetical protein
MKVDYLDFAAFADRYCERQKQTPEGLLAIFRRQSEQYRPVGWIMFECQVMDSSQYGHLVVLPYGPDNTVKQIPQTPVSLDGTASGTSCPVAVLLADRLEEVPDGHS